MNAVTGSCPRFYPGSEAELDGYLPTPEMKRARWNLILDVTVDETGTFGWGVDPVRQILPLYGFKAEWNLPPFELVTGPERWIAESLYAFDQGNGFHMEGSITLEFSPRERIERIARSIADSAGVREVRVSYVNSKVATTQPNRVSK